MLFLAASLAALLTGPAVGSALERAPRAKAIIEWIVVGGLLLLILGHVLPEAVELAHIWVLPVAALSGLATLGLERWANAQKGSGNVVLALGMLTLGIHSALDGAALAGADGPGAGTTLAFAVVLHRLPTSLAIWWLVKRTLSARWAAIVIGWDGVTTAAGFFASTPLLSAASPVAVGMVQAVIAGSLLHVAFHVRGHGHGARAAAASPVP